MHFSIYWLLLLKLGAERAHNKNVPQVNFRLCHIQIVVNSKRQDGRTCDEIRKFCKLYFFSSDQP